MIPAHRRDLLQELKNQNGMELHSRHTGNFYLGRTIRMAILCLSSLKFFISGAMNGSFVVS